MIKVTHNPNNITGNRLPNSKCAEIHYLGEKFNIICFECKDLFYEYQKFIEHFQKHHLYDLIPDEKCNDKSQVENKVTKNEHWGITSIDTENLNGLEANADLTSLVSFDLNEETSDDLDWSYSNFLDNQKTYKETAYKTRNESKCCSYCGKTFRRRYQLNTHINIHTGLKPHQCEICGRQFRAITTLQRHLNTHESRQIFKCHFCCKEFTHRAALVSHETRHTQERNIPCDDCNKLFYTKNQLDTHRRKLHNKVDDFSLPYACDICPKRYRSASMLSTHKFKKHYKTAKYHCAQCDKKFVEQMQLDTHMSIHLKKS